MDVLEAIRTRRSVRKFTDEPVTDEDLDLVLHAAMSAPSATNERPWRFVVVREPEMLSRLSRATPYAGSLAHAGVGIAVVADKSAAHYPGFWVIDCSAAIENMLLAAHGLGLGGVWIGVHPVRPLSWNVRRILGLPARVAPHSLVALGHPAGVPAPVDRFDASFIHRERW